MKIKEKLYIAMVAAGALFMGGCRDELSISDVDTGEQTEMVLHAVAGDISGVDTRANNSIYDINSELYPGATFHIYMEAKDKDGNETGTYTSKYVIPSGYKGALLPKEVKNEEGEVVESHPTLNWHNREGDHTLWSWTTPWDNSADTETGDIDIIFEDTYIKDAIYTSSNMQFQPGSWANGKALKQSVGTVAGPMRFVDKGQFVTLQYRHLMSLIMLGQFVIVDNSTATSASNLRGNITLYGLPRNATLHTTPTTTDANGNIVPTYPYVTMSEDFDYNPAEGVTFAITNSSRAVKGDNNSSIYNPFLSYSTNIYDEWYICPEVDLSRLSFKIEIWEYVTNVGWKVSTKYGENGAFYGDFSNIQLTRTPGSNYDSPDGGDATILHAGEYLFLGFNLSTKGNPSIMGVISDWSNTTQDRGASKYDKDGLYTIRETQDLSEVMNSGDRGKIDEYFGVYGSGERTSDNPDDPYYDEDLGIFKLYEDIGYTGTGQSSTTGSTAKMSAIYVADGYVLDGMGHMVNMSTSSPKIGNIRNVYLRSYTASYSTSTGEYFYYEYIVYIDKSGQVWKVDPVTYEQTDTGYNVNDVSHNPKSISLSTGKVT